MNDRDRTGGGVRQPGRHTPEHPVPKGAVAFAADDDQVRVDPVGFPQDRCGGRGQVPRDDIPDLRPKTASSEFPGRGLEDSSGAALFLLLHLGQSGQRKRDT